MKRGRERLEHGADEAEPVAENHPKLPKTVRGAGELSHDDPGPIGRSRVLEARAGGADPVSPAGPPPPPAAEPEWSTLAGSAYSELITGQVSREDARKTSFEARGITIITSSGAIVTLLFGLVAVVTKSDTFVLHTGPKVLLAIALGLFLVAAICGIVANVPLRYDEADPEGLRLLLEEPVWQGRVRVGARRTAELQIDSLKRARRLNALKGRLLIAGLSFEVAGVVAVAIAVLLLLV